MNLLIIFGLPGVGKKTVAEIVAQKSSYTLFDNHQILDVVRNIIPRTHPASTKIAREFRLNLLEQAAKLNTTDIILTVAGGSPGAKDYVQQCVDAVHKHGASVHFIHLQCDNEEHIKRILHPDRLQTKITSKEELDEFLQKDYFKGLPQYPPTVINNTSLSAEVCANTILKKIQKGAKPAPITV